MKLNPKMGFWRAKHGLSKHGFKDQQLVSFGKKEQNVKEEEEEEEEIKKKGMELLNLRMELWIFGMETNLDYEFYEIWHVSLGLYDDYFAQT